MKKAFDSKSVSQIVLPWGSMHIAGLYEGLIKMGFHQTKLTDVLLVQESDKGHWDTISSMYDDSSYTDHYAFEDS